jgi:hypothetical protein
VHGYKSPPAPRKRRRAPPGGKKRNLISGAVEHGCPPYLARASSRICPHTTLINKSAPTLNARERRRRKGAALRRPYMPPKQALSVNAFGATTVVGKVVYFRPCTTDKMTTCTRPKCRRTGQEDGDAASDHGKGRQMAQKRRKSGVFEVVRPRSVVC